MNTLAKLFRRAAIVVGSLALGFTLVGCDDDDVASLSADERDIESDGDRAFALANEIVTGLAQSYADRHYGGEVRTFAVDVERFDDMPMSGLGDRVTDRALERGLHRVAAMLRSDRVSWTFYLQPLVKEPYTDAYSIHAYVDDLHADGCCAFEAVELARTNDGWTVEGFFFGGNIMESPEDRQARLAKAKSHGPDKRGRSIRFPPPALRSSGRLAVRARLCCGGQCDGARARYSRSASAAPE